MPVRDILLAYLREHGYGGLCNEEGCRCSLDALIVCQSACDACVPGYQVPCDCGEGCVYHIVERRGDDA